MTESQVPPPPPDAERPPLWVADSRAKGEEKNWSDEDKLRGQKTKNDLLWLKVYGWIVVLLAIFITLIFVASLGIWCFHFLVGPQYIWLEQEQLNKIQDILFSGGLGAVLSFIAQRQISK